MTFPQWQYYDMWTETYSTGSISTLDIEDEEKEELAKKEKNPIGFVLSGKDEE